MQSNVSLYHVAKVYHTHQTATNYRPNDSIHYENVQQTNELYECKLKFTKTVDLYKRFDAHCDVISFLSNEQCALEQKHVTLSLGATHPQLILHTPPHRHTDHRLDNHTCVGRHTSLQCDTIRQKEF